MWRGGERTRIGWDPKKMTKGKKEKGGLGENGKRVFPGGPNLVSGCPLSPRKKKTCLCQEIKWF